MNDWYLPLLIIGILGMAIPFIDTAHAQVEINVTDAGQPCFLNYTAGLDMWENCGADEDYIAFALLPWEWVTGGFFSMIIVSVLIIMVYMKYKTFIYPIAIGIIFIPMSYFTFPDVFLSWSLVMMGIGFGILIWYGLIRQTKEY
jgi:hypothetical protein